jgi:hypothetical protein
MYYFGLQNMIIWTANRSATGSVLSAKMLHVIGAELLVCALTIMLVVHVCQQQHEAFHQIV